ncbi:hypothetical protein E2E27_05890 [Porphyrobacter sp. YT40]|nr:hypothetical protein E2E27_05890 [Porphyrobacter sp. YT40]
MDYFTGQRLHLRSPLPAQTAAQRINDAAGSMFWPFAMGVVGGVWLGNVRLQYRSSPFEYNAKPVLAGRLRDVASGSSLELRYRAPLWVYGFYFVWYLFLTLVGAVLIGNGWAPDITSAEKAMAVGITGLLLVVPIVLHAVGTRRSGDELAAILDFVSSNINATR